MTCIEGGGARGLSSSTTGWFIINCGLSICHLSCSYSWMPGCPLAGQLVGNLKLPWFSAFQPFHCPKPRVVRPLIDRWSICNPGHNSKLCYFGEYMSFYQAPTLFLPIGFSDTMMSPIALISCWAAGHKVSNLDSFISESSVVAVCEGEELSVRFN